MPAAPFPPGPPPRPRVTMPSLASPSSPEQGSGEAGTSGRKRQQKPCAPAGEISVKPGLQRHARPLSFSGERLLKCVPEKTLDSGSSPLRPSSPGAKFSPRLEKKSRFFGSRSPIPDPALLPPPRSPGARRGGGEARGARGSAKPARTTAGWQPLRSGPSGQGQAAGPAFPSRVGPPWAKPHRLRPRRP